MKRFVLVLLGVLMLGAMVGAPIQAADAQDFAISSMEVDYHLSRDANNTSQLQVTEKIVAEFPHYDQNHGILRAIPKSYQNHPLEVRIQQVVDGAGRALSYESSTSNDNLVLKIGDAKKYVYGQQTYSIAYQLQHVAAKFEDHDELFWDVNGDQWQQPFGQVTARIHLPAELAGKLRSEKRCYTGRDDSQEVACSIAVQPDGGATTLHITTTRSLQAGETLSFVLGFEPGTFAAYKVPLSKILWIAAGVFFLGVLPPLLALIFVLHQWRKYGRDPQGRGIIIPEYVVPKGLSVLGSSSVLFEGYRSKAITAQLLDLAVRHYLKIYEVKEKKLLKDVIKYEIELVRDPKTLASEEQAVIAMVFGDKPVVGSRVKLATLTNKLHSQAQKLGKQVDEHMASAGYFKKVPSKAKQPYVVAGIVLTIMGFVFIPWTLGLAGAGVVILIASNAMPARTLKGVELRDYLLGLERYMKLAEAERLKVLQSPHGKLTEKIDVRDTQRLVKLYEKLLPYAMLFGIEKDWAKQFADLYQQPPQWYSSSSGNFQTALFAGSLANFASSSNATFTPPSSSSSSGFSGGGAGGGGGGGGGGGW